MFYLKNLMYACFLFYFNFINIHKYTLFLNLSAIYLFNYNYIKNYFIYNKLLSNFICLKILDTDKRDNYKEQFNNNNFKKTTQFENKIEIIEYLNLLL